MVQGPVGFEANGIGGGPHDPDDWSSGVPEGVSVFWTLADFIRGGTGGGVFFGAMAAWILELSLSLNFSIASELYRVKSSGIRQNRRVTVELLCTVYRKLSEE